MATTDIYHISGGLKGRKAVAFLGGDVDDGVQIDAFVAARVAANDTTGTFSVWFNIPDKTGTYCILGTGDANAVEYFYIAVVAGNIQIKAAKAGPDINFDMITTGANLSPHVWHHVAVVQNATKPKIYIDSVEYSYAKGNLTETDVTEAGNWFHVWSAMDGGHIGAADSIAGGGLLTLEFKGGISNVKYWNVALTDSQILDDFKGINYTTNLCDNWKFDGDYVDSVDATYNGTAVGDIILTNNYSEFTSRLRYTTGIPVVADSLICFADDGTGHAIVIQAA